VQAQEQAIPPDVDATIRAAMAQKNHEILERAAGEYEKLRQFDMAQRLLETALEIRGEVSGETGLAYAAGLVKLGDLALQRRQYGEADAFYGKAVTLGDIPEIVPALIQMGMKAYGQSDDIRAVDLFERALRVDPRGPKAGAAAMWLGNVRARNPERLAEAESRYLQAMSLQDPGSLEYAMTLEFYSFLLRKLGRDAEADGSQNRAREIRRVKAAALTGQIASTTSVVRVGTGVAAPQLLFKVEPEYSPEARAAKYQGTVMLYVEISPVGRAQNIRVARSLGLGLDEKAIDAVAMWKFKPGMNSQGNPITVAATIEVNFRLI
jgi:TonB family protein